MNKELILSVLVTTYNQEEFISQTLDSILSQEHDYSYEIIIGEDCSTDGTRKIIEDYTSRFPDIIKPFYNNPNKGLIKNYFETISQCKGKYIMDVAGDDFFLPGKIRKQINFMEENDDIGMCYGKAKTFSQKKNKVTNIVIGDKTTTFEQLLEKCGIPCLTVCFRKAVLNQYIHEINPLSKNWLMEDYPMWLWFSKNSKIKFLDDVFGYYRILQESISHSKDKSKRINFMKAEIEVKEFFKQKYLDEDFLISDIERKKAWICAFDRNYSRYDVLEHLSKVKNLNEIDKKLLFILKNPLLFYLTRKKWLG